MESGRCEATAPELGGKEVGEGVGVEEGEGVEREGVKGESVELEEGGGDKSMEGEIVGEIEPSLTAERSLVEEKIIDKESVGSGDSIEAM